MAETSLIEVDHGEKVIPYGGGQTNANICDKTVFSKTQGATQHYHEVKESGSVPD